MFRIRSADFVCSVFLIALALPGCVCGLSSKATAQQAFPGWSAPKIAHPDNFNRVTYPDIAVDGDIIHVVFRATFTGETGFEEPPEDEILLTEIQRLDLLLRVGDRTAIEMAGGRKKLEQIRKRLIKRLGEIRSRKVPATPETTSPVSTALYYTRSEDRGRTFWEQPVRITDKPIFYGQTALHLADDGLYVVFTAEEGDNIIRVFSTRSTDGGKTWSKPVRISNSQYHAFDPYLASIPRGLIVFWWEREETVTQELKRRDFEAMDELIEKIHVKGTTRRESRSIIKYARNIAGTWESENFLANARGVIFSVNAANGPDGEVYVYWVEENRLQMMVSREGGNKNSWRRTLDFAQVLDPDYSNVFLHDGEDYRFIRGSAEKRKATPLYHRRGLLAGEWKRIIGDQAQHSYPRIDFTKNETQVVWGTTDPTGNHILYFREDNKPPTSELLYPKDGNFTKYAMPFVWRGVDDIATNLTYRRTITRRPKPGVRTPPYNWSLYEALDHFVYKPLEDGYYTIYIQATDFSGNEEPTPSEFDFHTYYVPPSIQVEKDTLPATDIETRNVEIKWEVEDNSAEDSPILVAYRLDGNPVTAFSPRESVRIEGLTAGWHQIQLFAMDPNGNVTPFGETVSVDVKLELQLYWKQIPVEPKQGDVVFVKDDRVSLSWGVQENTRDKGIEYMTSLRITKDGVDGEWQPPQFNPDAEISGPGNTPLEEGAYVITVVGQDEYGNRIDNYIQCGFTVDHTPPTVEFAEPTYDPETKEPTISVIGKDNYTLQENLVYQFRINQGTAAESWSPWSKNASFLCLGYPVKWYSWGYTVDVRARDVAGNVMATPVTISLEWWVRNPWMLWTLAGLGVVLVCGVLFLIVSTILERRRARKLAEARRKAMEETPDEEEQEVPGAGIAAAAAAAGGAGGDDLFDVSGIETTKRVPAEDDIFGTEEVAPSSPGMGVATGDTVTDPFSTSDTAVLEDPFAETEVPSSTSFLEDETPSEDLFALEDEDEPLPVSLEPEEETASEDSETNLFENETAPPSADVPPGESEADIPLEIGGTEPGEELKRDWSPDEKVELDDHDLFDPL